MKMLIILTKYKYLNKYKNKIEINLIVKNNNKKWKTNENRATTKTISRWIIEWMHTQILNKYINK